MEHKPVLMAETIGGLAIRPDGIYVDATYGRGGHATAIIQQLNDAGRFYALDKDPAAIDDFNRRFDGDTRVQIQQTSFAEMDSVCGHWGIKGRVDGILMDLGVSSPQLNDGERGFSFSSDGPLDMRMDPGQGSSAAEWLMSADEFEIADVLWRYGEEKASRRLAKAIIRHRQDQAITRTQQLAQIIASVLRVKHRKKHPATRSFQAIRIHVNDELSDLKKGLSAAIDLLRQGGILAVISFHSLEDRIVKHFIRDCAQSEVWIKGIPTPVSTMKASLAAIGKPHKPGDAELLANPRSRSAVLRLAERL